MTVTFVPGAVLHAADLNEAFESITSLGLLPTSDPHVPNQIWADHGVLVLSGFTATGVGSTSIFTSTVSESVTGTDTATSTSGVVGFPGQVTNPVGFAAAPTFTSLTPSSITPVSGTSGSPQVYNFLDFNSGTGGVQLTAGQDWITFNGCRFQSNSPGNYNVQINGATHITFNFCSFTPLASLYTAPPGAAWPAAGANSVVQIENVNCTHYSSGYQYGLNVLAGGPITCNSCDFWGHGNGGPLFYSTTAAMLVNNCWIHDPCYSGSLIAYNLSTSTGTTINVPTVGIVVGYTVLPFFFSPTASASTASTTINIGTSGIGVGWAFQNISGITGSPTVVSITDSTHLVVSSPQTLASGVYLQFTFPANPTVLSITDSTHLVISSAINIPASGSPFVYSVPGVGQNGSHQDGTGYLNGGTPPNNVTIQNCTIAGVANTNQLAWQGGTSPFNNINHIGNYLSGSGSYMVNLAANSGADVFTNSLFTNNTFGTDIPWVFGPIYSDYSAVFHTASGNGNTWSGNKIHVVSGSIDAASNPSFTIANDGQFIWPDSSLHTTDFVP